MSMDKDPILEALARIEAKQDLFLENQDKMEMELTEIRKDTKRMAAMTGAAAGGVSGGLVTTGILLIKAKLGL
ncbi:hypothetical protein QG070_03435 [Kingella kingae]|uniref:hypothetical protein n=1 Tax=Kingella kingae TaxID=504 RepID=UPI002550FDA2|nr:hypothetical protein [Kingella kingae]MDK4650092.1 hypothetical protein [Kingella kingae]